MNPTISRLKLNAAVVTLVMLVSPAYAQFQRPQPNHNMTISRPAPPRVEAPERPSRVERPEPQQTERQEPRQTERQEPRRNIEREEPRQTQRQEPARTERTEPVQAPRTQRTEHTPASQPSHAAEPNRNIESSHREPVRTATPHEPARAGAINHNASPRREVETRRPDGTRLVSVGHNRGFVEHPIAAHPGYVSRTYVAGGRSYARVYRVREFHGFHYFVYVPRFYFQPLFYGWVFDPWPAPVYFAWGWDVAPWYAYYGPYFRPAPVYAAPALWLTDFVIAENLKAAYEEQQAAAAMAANDESTALSSEVKQLVAEEVRRQIAEERNAAAAPEDTSMTSELPPALDAGHRVFVVSTNLAVSSSDGATCTLTPGDIILRTLDAPAGNQAPVTVLAAKAGDCSVNTIASVDVAKLQEMMNTFREQIDNGLNVLAANQGRGGLPSGPAPKPRLSPDGAAQPDPSAVSDLLDEQQAAERMEAEARSNSR